MEFIGWVMKGWVMVDGLADLSEEELGEWVELIFNFVWILLVK